MEAVAVLGGIWEIVFFRPDLTVLPADAAHLVGP
jgi:hypothetical protein